MNIVFDLDGTLIDSAPDIQSTTTAILGKHGERELTLEETRSFIGEGAAVFVSRMMVARGIKETAATHSAIYEDFVAQYASSVDKAVFYPGAIEALGGLKRGGHPMALCTNKPELAARAVVRHMALEPLFDAVMAGDMLRSRKPEPDMLLTVIAELGGGATLYVGDSEIDSETAARANVPFALFSEGYRKAPVSQIRHDWVFDHFDALPGIVTKAATAGACMPVYTPAPFCVRTRGLAVNVEELSVREQGVSAHWSA